MVIFFFLVCKKSVPKHTNQQINHWLPRTTLSIMTFAPVLYDISPRACLGGMIYAVLWSGSILVGLFVATQGVVVFKGVLSNDYLWNGVGKWWWQGWMLKHTDHIDLQKVIFLKFTTIHNIYDYIYIWPFYVLKPSSFLYTQTFHVWIPWPHDASDLTFDLKLESWDLWLEISGILGNLEKRHPIEIPKPLEIGCSFQVPGHIVEVGYPHIELWIEITRYFNSSIDIKSLFTYTLIQRHVAPFWWVEVS